MPSPRQLARKLGVKCYCSDPEGTLSTLQVARRLVKDHGLLPVEALSDAADHYASPIDSNRAFWAAHYALMTAGVRTGLTVFEIREAGIDVLLPIFDAAILSQGSFNEKASRGGAGTK